ncbi:uncharacterized protein LOC129610414 [Condylostylus longicornis]|uniref:uncharacterized protein LOC129610414 n=1 Tax=Condylostylus longicornis TaxID=2530218 RepID=UPI00244E3879|nr:uncharacterized protein LOC129610414 [Condylostylus longicornis]
MEGIIENENCDKIKSHVIAVTAKVISNPVARSLFCPFCADEYLFEFSLKDHLHRKHSEALERRYSNELPESEQAETDSLCPYCKAVFYSKLIIPKHIFHHHGRNWLNHYQQNYGLIELIDTENNSTVMYTSCSPGLSDIFDKLMSKELDSENNLERMSLNSPKLKSILKKTPNKSYNPILGSPSSASIRRYRSELLRRSLSARRELRFDLPPLQKSPPIIRKHKKIFDLRRFFKLRKTSNKKMKGSPIQKSKKKADKYFNLNITAGTMITSTPVNTLDDTLDNFDVVDTYEVSYRRSNGKVKNLRRSNQPLLFSSEKFQCGYCDEKYTSNTDLLLHSEMHRSKCFLKKFFKCGQCGKKFFKNRNLLRHILVHNN